MKSWLSSWVFLSILFCISCTNNHLQNKQATSRNSDTAMHLRSDTIKATITNTKGETLNVQFDTVAHTALLIFKSDSIFLKQDTIASGVRYSNATYTYAEWHGAIILKRTGKVVFSNTN